MRQASLPVLLLASLLVALPFAVAQNETNGTATNETPVANETPIGNETPAENATPAPPAPVRITLEGRGEGTTFYFNIEGETQRNPRLSFQPGQEVTIVLKTISGAVHNFCTDVTGARLCTPLVSEGDEASLTFTVPEGATSTEYWCDPHRGSGMKGTLAVGDADAGHGGGAPSEDFQGETVDLADLGYPQCAGTKIPVATAEGAVGGPTVADYVERCSSTQSEKVDPHKGADYVIPASFLLMGLGVVAVYWVHRRYQP